MAVDADLQLTHRNELAGNCSAELFDIELVANLQISRFRIEFVILGYYSMPRQNAWTVGEDCTHPERASDCL